MANTGNDLWGWSCGGADAIEEEVKSFINFGQLCTIQVSVVFDEARGASTDYG